MVSGITEQLSPVLKIKISSLERLFRLLYPDRCLLCRQLLSFTEELPLCGKCRVYYHPAGQVCPQCERLYLGGSECTCSSASISLQRLFAIAFYDRKWRLIIHNLKYRKCRSLARQLGLLLAMEIISRNYCVPQLIVPIPLHSEREGERGFNQSALIAGYASRFLGVPCRNMLVKMKDTVSQTTISREQRYKNISGVFSCNDILAKGATVLLIDDIYSTGATMKEAARVLVNCGATVYGAVVAYNPRIAK